MFKKILIANRGEIAVRVIAALKELGITSLAIYSEADKNSRHVTIADQSRELEGQPAKVYLDGQQIIKIAREEGAEAIHPGYGFLSENADFAEQCAQAGIKFIGPEPDVIRRMGSKVEARRTMAAAGVPVVPGTTDPVTDAETVKQFGTKYGYPLAIKASAGGGGRGLKVVRSEADIESALSAAQREGSTYFGSGEVYIEKYLDTPRHIEVQVLGDEHGTVVHLGERDCSSQRRHQKLLEETPAPNLDKEVREKLLESAVKGARALNYSSAGTLEFLVSDKEFYFLEVNTRVQVEHPITEMVTGIDIVKEQIRIAAGEKLSFAQGDVAPRGHAIEFRINAEDPFKNFMPNPGTIKAYEEPRSPWTRVDSACYEGYQILPFYDSLLAKLVVWGRTRDEAIARGKVALPALKIDGVATTIPFHQALLDDERFKAGLVSTKYVEAEMMKGFKEKHQASVEKVAAAAGTEKKTLDSGTNGKSGLIAGAQRPPQASTATVPGQGLMPGKGSRSFAVEVNDRVYNVTVKELADSSALGQPGARAPLGARDARSKSASAAAGSASPKEGQVRSVMNGLVKEILVKKGDAVKAGQTLVIFEAMKMESEIASTISGTVSSIDVAKGDNVDAETLLLTVS